MNQLKHILSSLFEPLTKVETYENLITKVIMILIYILVAIVVIAILNKIIEQAFKIQNKSKGNKTFKNTDFSCTKHSKIYRMVCCYHNNFVSLVLASKVSSLVLEL